MKTRAQQPPFIVSKSVSFAIWQKSSNFAEKLDYSYRKSDPNTILVSSGVKIIAPKNIKKPIPKLLYTRASLQASETDHPIYTINNITRNDIILL